MLKSLRKGNFGGRGKAIAQSPVENQLRMRVGNKLISEALSGQSQKLLSVHPKNVLTDQRGALGKLVILPGHRGLAQKVTGTGRLPFKDLLDTSPPRCRAEGAFWQAGC